MAKRVDLNDRKRMLDVGGVSGAYSLAFCAAYPQLTATILDFPQTIETARRYPQEAGMAARIMHLCGNAIIYRLANWTRRNSDVLFVERGRRQ
jgi:predicted O-methyltransferase YrrM